MAKRNNHASNNTVPNGFSGWKASDKLDRSMARIARESANNLIDESSRRRNKTWSDLASQVVGEEKND